MARLSSLWSFLQFSLLGQAALVTYNWDIGWVSRNPDGLAQRPVIGINGQWPLPPIVVTKGDQVIINVKNSLGNESTTIHFHGLYMNGTAEMDGPADVVQCEIVPGHSLTYNFTVDQPGTYWYHSHVRAQYPDGLRGALIVHDPDSPYKGMYDEEVVLTFSDWYHDQMPGLLAEYLSRKNPTGAEPEPHSALMNDTQNLTVSIQPGKTYFFRLINISAFATHFVWFEGHTVKIIEVDGVYTQPADADMLTISAAQRYGVLLTAKNDTSANFPIVASMDETLFDEVPAYLNPNVTGWLVYDDKKPKPAPKLVDQFNAFDDFTLVPQDNELLLTGVDHQIELTVQMETLGNGINYAFFNDVTYVAPKVPTLYTVLSSGNHSEDPTVYGVNAHPLILKKGEIVEIVLNNNDGGNHPFHLHGHAFQVAHRSDENAGNYVANVSLAKTPMRRDTMIVYGNGNMVLRFRADNPGVWLFHCHIEWHIAAGLVATVIEAPTELQKTITIPPDHLAACKAAKIPTRGNAAGNVINLLDLTGANVSPGRLPAGFTPRGIVALVFSVLAALLGVSIIAWYGAAPLENKPAIVSTRNVVAATSSSSNPEIISNGDEIDSGNGNVTKRGGR